MVIHWPKTVYGNVILFMLALMLIPVVVWVAVSLSGSGPLVWGALAGVALTFFALFVWRRRTEAARERAWVGAFSFGDVIDRMRARDAVQVAAGH